jgi:hypothetical protein
LAVYRARLCHQLADGERRLDGHPARRHRRANLLAVYIRASVQDGSFGEPIHNAPWNLSARYDLDPRTYEQGGEYAPSLPAIGWM